MTAVTKKKLNVIFIYILYVICVPNFSSLGWFSFLSAVNCCHQLSTAVESWWLLMTMKINLYIWNLANISPLGCGWKLHLVFFHNSYYQLLTSVDSGWQLITTDNNENHPRTEFWHIYHLGCKLKFHLILFLTALISCWQLMTDDNNW